MGRKKKYKVLKLPSDFDELKSYIKENTLELTEQVLDSINHAIDNDLKFIEVFQFKRSKFSVTITDDTYSDNINNVYDLYIELEEYELCENVLNIGKKNKLTIKDIRLTEKQIDLIKKIRSNDSKIIFISGPAGTSKTYTSILGGLHLLNDRKVSELIYVRSAVESADSKLGFLPGELDDKLSPYIQPLIDKLEELLYARDISDLKTKNVIKGFPVNFLRGLNWNAKFIIADEAQNMTKKELITLITRVGNFSKLIICGDPDQSDIHKSGFVDVLNIFNDEESCENGIYVCSLEEDDILRSELVKFILKKIKKPIK
jgi:phosphate starvation-inducible PhoH-like protein